MLVVTGFPRYVDFFARNEVILFAMAKKISIFQLKFRLAEQKLYGKFRERNAVNHCYHVDYAFDVVLSPHRVFRIGAGFQTEPARL